MRHLPYNKKLKMYARELRNHSTMGEILLWKHLRARNFMGYQFYRQKPIENYIVDFYCPALKLVIEVDGIYHTHDEAVVKDELREAKLKVWGLHCIRFQEKEVRTEIIKVLNHLENSIVYAQSKNVSIYKKKCRNTNPPNPL